MGFQLKVGVSSRTGSAERAREQRVEKDHLRVDYARHLHNVDGVVEESGRKRGAGRVVEHHERRVELARWQRLVGAEGVLKADFAAGLYRHLVGLERDRKGSNAH